MNEEDILRRSREALSVVNNIANDAVTESITILDEHGFSYEPHELCDGYYKNVLLYRELSEINEKRMKAAEELKRLNNPLNMALEIFHKGQAAAKTRQEELTALINDDSRQKYGRFKNMIQAIYNYLEDRSMRLEPFQLELLRGTIIGIGWNQLKEDLYKYKHEILDLLGLATPEIKNYDPRAPNVSVTKQINAVFATYAKAYTLGMAPRQCGKTTIMALILAACVIFLEITILVIAQNKNMSETVQTSMMGVIAEFIESSWFNDDWKFVEGRASSDTRIFIFKPEYKGESKVSFISSSPNVSTCNGYPIVTLLRISTRTMSHSRGCIP